MQGLYATEKTQEKQSPGSSFLLLSFYGLQIPQGEYPSETSSSLVEVTAFLFAGFIEEIEEQSSLWNFMEFVLITYVVSAFVAASESLSPASVVCPLSRLLSPVA